MFSTAEVHLSFLNSVDISNIFLKIQIPCREEQKKEHLLNVHFSLKKDFECFVFSN